MSIAKTSPEDALKAAKRAMRVCRECFGFFVPRIHMQKCCGVPCNRSWHNRHAKRGAMLYPVAMAWRIDRGQGSVKVSEVTTLLDRWHIDDKDRRDKYRDALKRLKEEQRKC